MTLQQYRDAFILFSIPVIEIQSIQSYLDRLQPSHFLKSKVRGHWVNVIISV